VCLFPPPFPLTGASLIGDPFALSPLRSFHLADLSPPTLLLLSRNYFRRFKYLPSAPRARISDSFPLPTCLFPVFFFFILSLTIFPSALFGFTIGTGNLFAETQVTPDICPYLRLPATFSDVNQAYATAMPQASRCSDDLRSRGILRHFSLPEILCETLRYVYD
jgi:hypothetical protein